MTPEDDDDLIGDLSQMDAISADGLTRQERAFVDAYASKPVLVRAVESAGYAGNSTQSAVVIGRSLLSRKPVRDALDARRKELEELTFVTAVDVIQEYARIAFFDPRRLFRDDGSPIPIHELSEDVAASIAGLDVVETEVNGAITNRTYKFKLEDKSKALDALAKYTGVTGPARVEITGKDGAPLIPDEVPETEKARRVAYMLFNAMRQEEAGRLVDIEPESE